jgi:hypothetical protein
MKAMQTMPVGQTGPDEPAQPEIRFFLTYSGVKLPLRLVDPLPAEALSNRNTYLRASFDAAGRLLAVEKMVYGEVELSHRYGYDDGGVLRRAEIHMLDEESMILHFDEAGAQIVEAGK